MDPPAWTLPVARLSNAVQNDISPHLLFPVSLEPSSSTDAPTSGAPSATAQQPAALEALLGALAKVDLSFLKPISPAAGTQPYVPPAGSLQAALLARDPHAFSLDVPVPAASRAAAPASNRANGTAPSANAAQRPSKQQQQQQAAAKPVAEPAPLPTPSLKKRQSLTRQQSDDAAAAASTAQGSRHKRRRRQNEEGQEPLYVPKGVDAAQVADATANAVAAFLKRARKQGNGDDDTAEPMPESADGEGDVQMQEAGPAHASQQQLKSLSKQLAQAKAAGVVTQLEVAQLRELLLLLRPLVALGADRMVADDDEMDAPAVDASLSALDAAVCCLQILSAPGLASELYMQELLDACLASTKYQLQYNVLVFHDLRCRRLYRPTSMQSDPAAPVPKKGASAVKAAAAAAMRAPECAAALRGGVEQCLSLLSEVVGHVQVEAETLLPLLRIAMGALSVDRVPVLQVEATALAVSVFRHYSGLRSAIMDEFLTTVLSDIGTHAGRAPPRHCLVAEEGALHIQTAVALVLQLLEAAAELPPVDAEPSQVASCFSASIAWADRLWAAVFERLPTARAQKSDTSLDFKAVVEHMVTDMLNVQMLPEWPSASTALRRFLKALCGKGGLKHADNAVKLMCVDFAGHLAGRLCSEALQCEDEATWVDGIISAAATSPDESLDTTAVLQSLLLDALRRFPGPHASSARRFMVCRMLYEQLEEQQKGHKAEPSAEEVTALLVAHRQMHDRQQSSLGASTSGAVPALDPPQATKLVRRLIMDGYLGIARTKLLMLLADAGDRSRQDANAAQVRAKAVKALASVVESDPRVLAMSEVHSGVSKALMDEAVSVREAALDLLGKYISSNAKYAETYFDVLCRAVQDSGLSVRKRAIKTLWDCCVRCPGFSRAPEAVMAILQRVVDQEESMRAFVTKICSQLWFNPAPVADTGSSEGPIERTAAQRATELARVALMVYEAGGRTIHVPLASDHPLVVVLKEALGDGAPEGASEVAEALLEQALALQGDSSDTSSTAPAGVFPYLLSLHALAAAQPALCMPDSDPARFIRCLAPYLSATMTPKATDTGGMSGDEQRRAAEETLCLLCVVDVLAGALRHLDADLVEQMMKDLAGLISRHAFMQVMANACQCLCSLAALQPKLAAKQVSQMVNRCVRMVEGALPQPESPDGSGGQCVPLNPTRVDHVPRLLFLLGQLCRYGAPIIDDAAAAATSPTTTTSTTPSTPTPATPPPTTRRLCALFIHAFRAQGLPPKVAEAALHALGLLFVAKPELMMESKEALDILSEALGPQSSVALRTRALCNLVELLRAEEEGMVAKQRAAEAAAEAKQVASTLVRVDSKTLAKQNGEGDGSSLTSAILQRMWSQVLSISTDVTHTHHRPPETPPKTPSATSSTTNTSDTAAAAMRRKALELIEATLRGGLVAPWTAIPSLVALLTDANTDTKARALRVLKAAIDKYPDFVLGQLSPAGITGAYDFQRRQWAAAHPGQPLPKAPSGDALRGLAAMYAEVVQPDAKLRTRFLSSLLKPFDEASCLVSSGAASADVHSLAFCVHTAAALPCRRGDEPLTLLHAINGVVSRHGHDVLDRLRKGLKAAGFSKRLADADEDDDGAAEAEGSVGNVPNASKNESGKVGGGVGSSNLDAPLRASLALSMLLVLKQWLVAAYSLSNDRVAAFELKGERRRAEEKVLVSKSAKVAEFGLAVVNLRVLEDATGALLVEQYRVVSGLMDNDAANYKQAAVSAQLNGVDDDHDAADATHAHAATPAGGLVVFQTTAKKPPRTGASTGRSKRGRGTAAKGGGGSARSMAGKRKHVVRKVQMSDDEEMEDE